MDSTPFNYNPWAANEDSPIKLPGGTVHRTKLELTQLKLSYFRLYQEMLQYSGSGYSDYLQVVWKHKIYEICDLLVHDAPIWLPCIAIARLNHLMIYFSNAYVAIPRLDRSDRNFLTDVIHMLLQNWDSYIDAEVPKSNEEVILAMTFEKSSMKDFYRNELTKIGMTSFVKSKFGGPFQITGRVSPDTFYRSLETLLWKYFHFRSQDVHTIVEYRAGSQTSLTSID